MAIIFGAVILYWYVKIQKDFDTTDQPYKNYIGYIDQENALLNDAHKLCDQGNLYYTYNGAGLKAYSNNKKKFRERLAQQYKPENFSDSGYLNYRFLVNCDGNPGWFEIIQMDLNLKEKQLDPNMVKALLTFTSNPENWNSLEIEDTAINYYMYVSYRIENGKVTEVIP